MLEVEGRVGSVCIDGHREGSGSTRLDGDEGEKIAMVVDMVRSLTVEKWVGTGEGGKRQHERVGRACGHWG